MEKAWLPDADRVANSVGTGEALLRCTQFSSSPHREPLSEARVGPDTGHTDCLHTLSHSWESNVVRRNTQHLRSQSKTILNAKLTAMSRGTVAGRHSESKPWLELLTSVFFKQCFFCTSNDISSRLRVTMKNHSSRRERANLKASSRWFILAQGKRVQYQLKVSSCKTADLSCNWHIMSHHVTSWFTYRGGSAQGPLKVVRETNQKAWCLPREASDRTSSVFFLLLI